MFGRKAVEAGCGLVVFGILARTLTQDEFGIYTLVLDAVALLQVTALRGLGASVQQGFARGSERIFRLATVLSAAGAAVGCIVLVAAGVLHIYLNELATGYAFLSAALLFAPAEGLRLWRAALVGAGRYGRYLLLDGTAAVFRLAVVAVCALMMPATPAVFVLAVLSAPALINVLSTSWQWRLVPAEARTEYGATKYGLWATLYQVPSTAAKKLDALVLFYFVSPAGLAVYAVAQRLPELTRTMAGDLTIPLTPVFARSGRYGRRLYAFTLTLWLVYLSGAAVFALAVIPYLVPLLAGGAYEEAIPYAQVMTVGAAFGYLGTIQTRYVKSQLNRKLLRDTQLAKALVDSGLVISLGYFYGLNGVVGAYVLKHLGFSIITAAVLQLRR